MSSCVTQGGPTSGARSQNTSGAGAGNDVHFTNVHLIDD